MDKSAVAQVQKFNAKIASILEAVESKNAFSSVEKDLILQHLREMYDAVLEVKPDKIAEEPKKVAKKEEVKRVEPVKAVVEEVKKQKQDVFEEPKQEELIIEIEPVAVKEEIIEQVQETHEIQQQSKQILAEKLAKPEPLLHDVVAQQVSITDLSTKFQQKEIASLTQSIQINDRFLFIKELFHDDAKFYNESLLKMDGMESIDAAVSFLTNEINIDLEKDAAKKLLQLINRKFGNV